MEKINDSWIVIKCDHGDEIVQNWKEKSERKNMEEEREKTWEKREKKHGRREREKNMEE